MSTLQSSFLVVFFFFFFSAVFWWVLFLSGFLKEVKNLRRKASKSGGFVNSIHSVYS